MSAGTINLTNSSTAVTGTGTTFTADLSAGDFIVATVGGVTYTLAVQSVGSDTGVTLVSNYTGPTQNGNAWSAVPRATMNQITAALVAQTTEAMRGLNADKHNWQQVFTGTGNVTIALPDGSTYTGPAWNSIMAAVNSKAESTDARLNTIDGKTGGVISGTVAADRMKSSPYVGPFDGSIAQGVTPYYVDTAYDANGQSASPICGGGYQTAGGYLHQAMIGFLGAGTSAWSNFIIHQRGDAGTAGKRTWVFSPTTGDIVTSGEGAWDNTGYVFQKSATSDATLKDDIQYNDGEDSYENVKKIKPATFVYKSDKKSRVRRGVIAQDVMNDIDQEYVRKVISTNGTDSTLALDNNVIMADTLLALHYTIKQLERAQEDIKDLKAALGGNHQSG